MLGCTPAWRRALQAKLRRASGSGFKVGGATGTGKGRAQWALQGWVHLSYSLIPQPLQMSLGPGVPALWLAWRQGS